LPERRLPADLERQERRDGHDAEAAQLDEGEDQGLAEEREIVERGADG
jgi:hypothetical protein